MWDPNEWETDNYEYRIYGDDHASVYAVVDAEDYQWCIQWLWSIKWSRGGTKFYLRRLIQSGHGKDGRTRHTRFLHQEIMDRKGDVPPDEYHILIDHRDGKSLNCRRSNLRWATHSMNSRNRFRKMR